MKRLQAVKFKDEMLIQKKAVKRSVLYSSFACIMILALNLLLSILAAYSGTRNNFVLYMLLLAGVSIISMLAPTFICSHLQGGWRKNMRRYKPRCGKFDCMLMVLFGFGACILLNFLTGIIAQLLPWLGGSGASYFGNDFVTVTMMIFTCAVVPAVCEELAFRGIIMGMLARCGEDFAVVVSALCFGLLHSSFTGALFAFGSGIVFGIVRKTSGRLLPTMLIHFMNNAFAVRASVAAKTFSNEGYSRFFLSFLTLSLVLMLFSLYALRVRKIGLLKFKKRKCQLSTGTKAMVLISSPTFLVFVVLTVIDKVF